MAGRKKSVTGGRTDGRGDSQLSYPYSPKQNRSARYARFASDNIKARTHFFLISSPRSAKLPVAGTLTSSRIIIAHLAAAEAARKAEHRCRKEIEPDSPVS